MANETLELSEYELYFLPSGTAATAPATRVEVEVDGEKYEFLARLVICRHERDDINIHRLFYRAWQNEVVGICGSREVRSYEPSLTESEKDLTTNDQATVIRWIYCWRAAICEIMRPSFWRDEPEYMVSYRRSNREREKPFLIFRGQPTAHEFLEAQTELRDFLRPHLPDDEIEK